MSPLLTGIYNIIIYFAVAVIVAFSGRILLTIPNEVFRKILHFILLGSLYVFIISFPSWQLTSAVAVGFAVVVYPILKVAERIKKYSEFTTERKSGELKHSLILVFTMFAFVVAVCWGIFEDRYLALASLYAWGIGDAAAALTGKKYGKHKIKGPKLDGKKSWEGTTAMFVCSFFSVFAILMIRGGMTASVCLVISAVTAAVSAVSELYSRDGNDTVICPLCAMFTLVPMVQLLGGI